MVEPAHWAGCDPGAHSRAPPASRGTENTTEMMTCPHGRHGGALQTQRRQSRTRWLSGSGGGVYATSPVVAGGCIDLRRYPQAGQGGGSRLIAEPCALQAEPSHTPQSMARR